MGFKSVQSVDPELARDFQKLYPVILDEGRCTFSMGLSCQYGSETQNNTFLYGKCGDHNATVIYG